MSVAVDDDFRGGECIAKLGGSRTAELISVRHRYQESVQLESSDLRKLPAQVQPVHVSVNAGDRC